MRLLAISDLHLAHPVNRQALCDLPEFPDDWLIIAGDIGERMDHHAFAFRELGRRFKKLIWTPGNHDLWTVGRKEAGKDAGEDSGGDNSGDNSDLRGVARYEALVALAQHFGVVTPEDPFPLWSPPGEAAITIAPLFLLYDYSFRPAEITREGVRAWARAGGATCSDELFLHPDPWPSREAWCAARCHEAERRLSDLPAGGSTILINHWPLRRDLIRIPRIPRFTPWCGSTRTREWHRRFNARIVIFGHLHTRRTDMVDGCRFEEVSLGYPRQWRHACGMAYYLRQILPE